MRLVIDTNRIIASLIKDSTSRKIIKSGKIEFITVGFGEKEIAKYKWYILEKAKIGVILPDVSPTLTQFLAAYKQLQNVKSTQIKLESNAAGLLVQDLVSELQK